jgi:hypothetical protein
MKELSLLAGVIALWIALNRWVLPWFGIQTCCCQPCDTGSCVKSDQDVLESKGPQK